MKAIQIEAGMEDDDELESEDELDPDKEFVNTVNQMHDDGSLVDWLRMSHDASKNPLLYVVTDGVVRCADVDSFQENFPEFWNDFGRARKKHGCFMYLSNFVHTNYPCEIYDEPSLLLSQLQYLLIAILHIIE